MSRNGSGVMSIPNTMVSGEVIEASDHNENYSDISSEITNSVAVDGQSTMTGPLKASNGTAAAPSITFGSDTDTGLYRSAANKLSGAAGGVQIWEMSSSGIDIKTGSLLLAGVAVFPVPTAQIADDAITYAKIQNVSATARLLGRTTAGAGDVEEISLASGLSFVAGVLTPSISPSLVPNYLSGLTLSTAGSSATMSIAAGVANDSTNTVLMSLSAIAKTTSSWAVGTGNGGLDTGAIATSTWYHFYEIYRPDTGVTDAIFSLSASAPTLPTNYTLYRRIGAGKTNGSSQWTSFSQLGDEFLLNTPIQDSTTAVLGTGASTVTLASVPTGIQVLARISGNHNNAAVNGVLISSLDIASAAVDTPSGNSTSRNAVAGQSTTFAPFYVRTNTSAQIRTIASAANTTLNIVTTGWVDNRGK